MESGKSLHFKNLKQYRDETNATIDTNYFSIALKNMKDGFAERFEQFKANKSTLAFIVNPLNTNTNEINIEPFGIDAGSLQMQLLDLKTKNLWSGKFTELKSKLEELEIQKCMHIEQHKWTALKEIPRVEALIFSAWNSLPECYSKGKKLAYGVLTIFGLIYSCDQAFSCMNIIKSKVRSQLTNKNLESCLKFKTVLHERLGTIIQGQVDSNDSRTFFTDSYVAQHTARIRGALSALTRPVPLSSVISHFKFPEKLFYRVAEDLIKEGRLAGSISGGRSERAIFIPDIYAASQSDWINSFYKQNNYLEYDAVARLGILDPKTYLKKMFKNEGLTYLTSCCVGKNIINQVEAALEEALNSGTWVDIMPILPSIFTTEDCHGIIGAVTKNFAKLGSVVHVYGDSILVSDPLIVNCEKSFDTIMETKAKEVSKVFL
ncbi:E3 UFM1-protein ligase 1 [Araneus ventricosus]|uniref:E3 UFM1-protein ligase 1 homolog n=1 Tax=Araneus ventricosus TaxID=182803 RepID=A0A4Y2B4A8_ARAVE|nr:E3 UFM1-protein ligase 1 [Araneus ventricosus]